MDIYGYLKDGEAIKCGSTLFVHFERDNGYIYFKDAAGNVYNSGNLAVEQECLPITKVVRTPRKVVGFIIGGRQMSTEEFGKYSDLVEDVMEGLVSEYDTDEFTEAVRITKSPCETVWSDETEDYTEMEITIVGEIENLDEKYILNTLSKGMKGFQRSNLYQLDQSALVRDTFFETLKEYGATHNQSSSGVRFIDVVYKGTSFSNFLYAMGEVSGLTNYTSFELAKKAEKELRNRVRGFVISKLKGVSPSMPGLVTLSHQIANILAKVRELDCKTKAHNDKMSIVRSLMKLEETLNSSIERQGEDYAED